MDDIRMRIEIIDGPDRLGRYIYWLFWMANYHPGDPDGEYQWAERGQLFHAPLPSNKSFNLTDAS